MKPDGRGIAQPGRALPSGGRGRRFESSFPDQNAGAAADAARPAEQSTGAEDFAVFLEQVPGSLARLGVWDGISQRVDLHSSRFAADERAIAAGIRLMTHTAVAALQP